MDTEPNGSICRIVLKLFLWVFVFVVAHAHIVGVAIVDDVIVSNDECTKRR